MGGQGEENVAAVVAHPVQNGEVVAVAEQTLFEPGRSAVGHVQVIELSGTCRNVKLRATSISRQAFLNKSDPFVFGFVLVYDTLSLKNGKTVHHSFFELPAGIASRQYSQLFQHP